MSETKVNMEVETILAGQKMKTMFKKFIMMKLINVENEKSNKYNDYDPSEKLAKLYCIHDKTNSEISLFQEHLIKTELTDECIFHELKEKLEGEKLLEDLMDINISNEEFEEVVFSKDFISYLLNYVQVNNESKELALKLQNVLDELSAAADYKVKKIMENNIKEALGEPESSKTQSFPDSESSNSSKAKEDTSTEEMSASSDSKLQDRLNKLHLYSIAINMFGNRIEKFKLPGESVNHLIERLAHVLTLNTNMAAREEQKVSYVDFQNFSLAFMTPMADTHVENSSDRLSLVLKPHHKEQETASEEFANISISFPDERLTKLLKNKIETENHIIAEELLLSEVEKLKPDQKGWKDLMALKLKLMKKGTMSLYQTLCDKIVDMLKKKIEEEERGKVRYWSLLYDESGKENQENSVKNASKNNVRHDKTLCYKNVKEFLLSRDYESNFKQKPEKTEQQEKSDCEIPFEKFTELLEDELKRLFSSEEAAEYLSFICDPVSSRKNLDAKCDTIFYKSFPESSKGKRQTGLPRQPYVDEKVNLISRLSEVRGLHVKDDELVKPPPYKNPFPFGSRTSRGLSPIKNEKHKKAKKYCLDQEDRSLFLQKEGKFSLRLNQFKKNTNTDKNYLPTISCDRPIKQIYYPWEPPKLIGKQILPGTDIFIKPPKLRDLREEEDAWKYNLPPFDYMKCGLPEDAFALVSTKIFQQELLDQILMDLENEETEKKKDYKFRLIVKNRTNENKLKQERNIASHGNPPPCQYDVQRWPYKPCPKIPVISRSSKVPSFINHYLDKFKVKDYKPNVTSVLGEAADFEISKADKTEVLPEKGIKMWRNFSLGGLKNK